MCGFTEEIQSNPRFMDTSLLWTVCFVSGEGESPFIFSKIQPA